MKKIIGVIVILALIAVLLPAASVRADGTTYELSSGNLTAGATNNICTIFPAMVNGDTVKLKGDIILGSTKLNFDNAKGLDITFDLNGFTITLEQSVAFLVSGDGELVITDGSAEKTGKLQSSVYESNPEGSYRVVSLTGAGALIIAGGTYNGFITWGAGSKSLVLCVNEGIFKINGANGTTTRKIVLGAGYNGGMPMNVVNPGALDYEIDGGSVQLTTNYTLAEGRVLNLKDGTLTVAEGVNFTNNGSMTLGCDAANDNNALVNNGTIVNEGTITNQTTLTNAGTFDNNALLINNGTLVNNGSFDNEGNTITDGEVTKGVANGGSIDNNYLWEGELPLQVSATSYYETGSAVYVQNSPTYVVTIPERISLTPSVSLYGTNTPAVQTFSIVMRDAVLNEGAKVKVVLCDKSDLVLSDNTSVTLPYTVKAGGTALDVADTFYSFTENGAASGSIEVDLSNLHYAGSYCATITFSIGYEP